MEQAPIVPVVLSGGSGTRLWPVSRHHTPKQLEPLVENRSMLAATLDRLEGLPGLAAAMVLCNVDHGPAVRREVRRSHRPDATVVLEPIARNTAPAVAVAAMLADSDDILLVMPADHVISDIAEFQRTAGVGATAAADGALVTFGIVPGFAATGYGYIRASGHGEVRPVDAFVEKPDEETARSFLDSGEYLWNSGMFMFRASVYLDELMRYEPEIVDAARTAVDGAARPAERVVHLDAEPFGHAPSISVDYAVMERTDRAVVVPLDAGWSDVGAWSSLREVGDPDPEGNVSVGDVVTLDVTDSYLRSDGPLVAALGLSGIVVVATPDAVLVAAEDRVEDVKAIVEGLRSGGRALADEGVRRSEDWGSVQILGRAGNGVVEQVTLDSGAHMTPQDGRWVVLAGTGRLGDDPVEPGDMFAVGPEPIQVSAVGADPLALIKVSVPTKASAPPTSDG